MARPKAWNGSNWIGNWLGRFKVWNGSAWIWALPKIWDGSSWVDQYIPPALDTQTITAGYADNSYNDGVQYAYGIYYRGYGSNVAGDSIVDGTSNIYSGASILSFEWSYYSQFDFLSFTLVLEFETLTLSIAGLQPNSGWTSVTVTPTSGSPVTFNRTSASYAQSGGNTYWTWAPGTPSSSRNYFNGGGAVLTFN